MRLIFLYGPPGVGKLTVARELASRTGIKIFHNHLTIDLVGAVFPRKSPSFGRLLTHFRREMLSEAAREGVDLVFTYVYVHPDDESNVRALAGPVLVSGGTVHFVQLTCARPELLARVANESRRAYGKLNDPAVVSTMLDLRNLVAAVPFADTLRIDTTDTSPVEAAKQILTHYSLPSVTEVSSGGRIEDDCGPRPLTSTS
jgi:hypothetical protein